MPDQTKETATAETAHTETITIRLIPAASAVLAASCEREGLSRTDAIWPCMLASI